MDRKRDYNIDLLKIMGCVAVVGLHTVGRNLSLINSTIYYLCGFAIPVFMMSSGAMLLNRKDVSWNYVASKIWSILRIVIVWNLLFVYTKVTYSYIFQMHENMIPFLAFAKDIAYSLIQKGVLFHFWYLGSLILLYILLPILVRIKRVNKLGFLHSYFRYSMYNNSTSVYG